MEVGVLGFSFDGKSLSPVIIKKAMGLSFNRRGKQIIEEKQTKREVKEQEQFHDFKINSFFLFNDVVQRCVTW